MREPFLNIAVEAARAAGNIIVRASKRMDKVAISEKNPNDFVTEVDQKAEKEIIYHIRKAYPTHSILAEESGQDGESDYQWIIDPLDGTRNFVHGFPHYAVSIAMLHKGRIEHAVIYDPVRDDLFTATRGRGAFLNNQRIRVGTRKKLNECLFGTGFAYRHRNKDEEEPVKAWDSIMPISGDIRRAGAATLDIAYVAAGRLDGFWEYGLKKWDIAAGILLVKEAGGIICDPKGGESYFESGDIVAANPVIIRQFLKQTK